MVELLLIKSSLAIGIAFLFYKLVLQRESFFAINRLYLLGCIVFAFALPFIHLPKLVSQQGYLSAVFQQETASEVEAVITDLGETGQTAKAENHEVSFVPPPQYAGYAEGEEAQAEVTEEPMGSKEFSLQFWLTVIYLSGAAAFTFSLLFQVGCLVYRIMKAKDKIRDGDYVIVNTADRQAPCSFFKYIFIYPDDYDFETYEQIIAHEKTHVRLGHSLDMLVAELAVIALWFNPLTWLLKREIEKNNEYQTDAVLLENEQVRKDQYQLNLLQIAVPNRPLNITTNYNQSLIKERIMMMNSKRSTPHAYWKYAFLAPLFFGMLLLINEPVASQDKQLVVSDAHKIKGIPLEKVEEATKEKIVETSASRVAQRGLVVPGRGPSINISGGQTYISKGYWYSSLEDGEYCIKFQGSKSASSWNMSRCFDTGAFQKKENDVFVMTKESGTLQLTGNLDSEVGQGKYTFSENTSFKEYLSNNDISSNNENLIFHLFFADVGRTYIDFLKKQYGNVNGDRLLELAIHGIPMEHFKNYLALFQKYGNKKPSIEEVVEARIHGIDEAYVEEIQKTGFKELSMKKMMEAKIHGVRPATIKEMQALGFGELSLDKIIELQIHDVNAAYINGLKSAGLENLTLDQIIGAKIHGVMPATIKEMQALGFGELSLDKIIELQIHGVNAAYINGLKSAGLENLTLDQIIGAKIHGVKPATIKEMQALGFGELNPDKIIELQIHGVNAAYVNELKSAGLENLTLNQIMEAKIHGLNPTSIKEIKAMGFKDLDFRDLMSAQIHGVNADYVEDLGKAGFRDLKMNKIVEAKIHGINSSYIEQARQKGYNLNSIDKYISLKIHASAMESLKEKEE